MYIYLHMQYREYLPHYYLQRGGIQFCNRGSVHPMVSYRARSVVLKRACVSVCLCGCMSVMPILVCISVWIYERIICYSVHMCDTHFFCVCHYLTKNTQTNARCATAICSCFSRCLGTNVFHDVWARMTALCCQG